MTVWYEFYPDDLTAIRGFENKFNSLNDVFEPCFGWYWENYKEGNMYYLFPCKDSIDNYLNDFNRKFSNIKITIVKEYKLTFNNRGWTNKFDYSPNGDRYVLLGIYLLGGYNALPKYVIPLVISTMLRYNDVNYFTDRDNFKWVKSVINYNNEDENRFEESSISYYNFDYEDLMVLDSVEKTNEIFKAPIPIYYGYGDESLMLDLEEQLHVGMIFKAILIHNGKDPNDGEYEEYVEDW